MGKSSGKTMLAVIFLVLIWGMSWPIYKVALPYTPPLLFAGMRSLFGATCGVPIASAIYFHLMNAKDTSKIASFTFLVP